MTTETSSQDINSVTLGPDWLRSKPVAVFSKNRYGQEEILNLWTAAQCPQSILSIPDLAAPEPVKPACLSGHPEESQVTFPSDSYHSRGLSSDRGRGRPSTRSRGGGVGRGGTRREFSGGSSRYFETPRSADSDNWRRRDPSPDSLPPSLPQPDGPVPVLVNTAEQPPSYPPYPPKSISPTRIDNRETNSWKRTEAFSPPQAISPPQAMEPPSPARTAALQFNSLEEQQHFKPVEDSPETMLRSISQSLYNVEPTSNSSTEAFNSHVLFSNFSDSQGGGGGGMFGSVSSPSVEIPGSLPSQLSVDIPGPLPSQLSNASTSGTTPTSPLDMPQLFNRDTISPQVTFPSSSSSLTPTHHTTSPKPFSGGSPPFPSLAEIGKSINNQVGGEMLRGPGFIPPPQPQLPPQPQQSLITIVTQQSTYRADEMWFYLDPKGNTQGPFDSVKMFGWFKEGYFGMDLKIRRSADTQFTKLEIMIQQCGRIPFQPEDKQSPPPPQTSQLGHITQPPAAVPAWTTSASGSIWGSTVETSSSYNGLTNTFNVDSEQVRRAEEIKKEIDRAVKLEQQRKLVKEEEEIQHLAQLENDKYLLAQRQIMEAKLAEEQQQQEEQMRKIREDEILKSKLFEEEAEKIRQEKERLELERIRQAEKVRHELEQAEKARYALEQERIKLEKERHLVKLKEEELRRRDEEERQRRDDEVRVAEERRAAQQAAAEAKALAKAQEEATASAIKEARRQADAKAKRDEQLRREEQSRREEQARHAAAEQAAAVKRREQENVWATKVSKSPPAQENTNPWANMPKTNVTKSATRTHQPTTKTWGKPDAVSIPLSQIQQDEAKMKKSAPRTQAHPEPVVSRATTWATQKQPSKTRSLAEIQREEERRTTQEQNLNYAQNNDWNPVAGMLEDDPRPAPKKQTKPPPKKPQQQQQQQPKAPTKKKNNQAPLLDMFANSTPKDEFTIWCESQVSGFKNQHIDVPTFISFLRDVESPREVREYVVSYLGDTLSTDKFIQEFIAKRKTANNKGAAPDTAQANNTNNKGNAGGAQQATQPQTTSKRGKRKKMQKVNAASLLGINCTASSDARNRGDIDSVVIQ
ncbi:GRB10-interacting GYF protein 2-like isoform X2 [Bolinopsis microptera]|uniref:GRB10-interacting GYF protein 2-like isoform X2 n=1 Tax=Bolinopsis microptera TaxID=2820187 RepID=UPI00307A94BC